MTEFKIKHCLAGDADTCRNEFLIEHLLVVRADLLAACETVLAWLDEETEHWHWPSAEEAQKAHELYQLLEGEVAKARGGGTGQGGTNE